MNQTSEYTFTSFYPSKNPFNWYYDENKKTLFLTSLDTEKWDEQPVFGDKIKLEKTPSYLISRAWINNRQVYPTLPQ